MADIRPFRGVRYNAQIVKDLAKVICPPYDIISPKQQEALYENSEYNFIRIEYNRESPQDSGTDNRYSRAAAFLSHWLETGILKSDPVPAFYLHEQYFNCQGTGYKRQNLLACVRLEEWDKKIILPHENIIPKAKSDRLNMLAACRANTSEVLAMYEDPMKVISFILASETLNFPLIDVVDSYGERHVVWAITQPDLIKQIQKELAGQPLYIADGHHRYDSALTYKREMAAKSPSVTGEEGFNFVMMSLIDVADPGLVILPTHRLLRGISEDSLKDLKTRLERFFEIEELDINAPDIWYRVDSLLTCSQQDIQQTRLAVFGLELNKLMVLTLRDSKKVSQFMPSFHGDLYRKLDVSLVDHLILEQLLKFDKDKQEGSLIYSHNRLEAVNRVEDHEYQLVFILSPVKAELIKAIADVGDRMPRKSTYFYPKSPAGLVFYKW